MGEAVNYIALAIPVFFLLIGVELLIGKLQKTDLYRFNDAITNISCGIGQQVIGVFIKTAVIIGYVFLYDNYRLWDISDTNPLMWFVLFIGVDFFYYWFHRLSHEVSFIWGSHVVHHQSEEYNLSVALRQGWFQPLFSNVFYLPLALAGFSPVLFIIINQFQTLYQFWIHTKTIGKLPAPVEYIFNTPSHHRVHHGVNPKYIDRNHGGTLIIFDRMFGTFQKEEEEVVYGITSQPKSWNPLWLNFEYWLHLFRDIGKTDNWIAKIKMLIKAPGWKPEELGGPETAKEVTVQTFQKYDTHIPAGLNYYILFQYLIVLMGTTGFLFMNEQLSELHPVFPWICGAFILFSIVNLSGLLEKKRWIWPAENVRLFLIVLLLFLFAYRHPAWLFIALVLFIFLILSAWWLRKYHNLFV